MTHSSRAKIQGRWTYPCSRGCLVGHHGAPCAVPPLGAMQWPIPWGRDRVPLACQFFATSWIEIEALQPCPAWPARWREPCCFVQPPRRRLSSPTTCKPRMMLTTQPRMPLGGRTSIILYSSLLGRSWTPWPSLAGQCQGNDADERLISPIKQPFQSNPRYRCHRRPPPSRHVMPLAMHPRLLPFLHLSGTGGAATSRCWIT